MLQRDVAWPLGYSQAYFSAIERGAVIPASKDVLVKLSQAYAMSPEQTKEMEVLWRIARRDIAIPKQATELEIITAKELVDSFGKISPAMLQDIRRLIAKT